MKVIITLFLFYTISYSQNFKTIPEKVKQLHNQHTIFSQFNVLSKLNVTANDNYKSTLQSYSNALLNQNILYQIIQQKPENILISLPFNNDWITVELYKKEITTPEFKIKTESGYFMDYEKGATYWGIIKDDYSSLVAFSFFNNEIMGVVSSKIYGDITIGKLKNDSENYILYSSKDVLVNFNTKCNSEIEDYFQTDNLNTLRNMQNVNSTNKCIKMYYELSNATFAQLGSDMTTSINWITAVHNNVSAVYANDGILNMPLSEVFVWQTPEPYDPGTYNGLLDFVNFRTSFNGVLANYVNTQAGSGFAWGVNNLCRTFHSANNSGATGPYAQEGPQISYNDIPTYSYTVSHMCHEIGHMLGSVHTHQCAWNGNGTQIDDCGNVNGNPQPCYDSSNPIIPPLGQGSIMSYCPGVLADGLGPQPRQVILSSIENATCFINDCEATCVPSINKVSIIEVGLNSAKISIEDDNPNNTEWELKVLPGDFVPINNHHLLTGLSPGNVYTIQVRNKCSNPLSSNYVYENFIHTGQYCNSPFYDYSQENSSNLYDYQTSLYPDNPVKKIAVHFNFLTLNQEGEYLKIYDGPSTSNPLIRFYTQGTYFNLPDIISSHPSGALYFDYKDKRRDYFYEDGWDATVNCVEETLTVDNSELKPLMQYYPNPVSNYLNIESNIPMLSIKLTDILGRVITTKEIHSVFNRLEMSNLPNGVYIITVDFENKTKIFKIIKR